MEFLQFFLLKSLSTSKLWCITSGFNIIKCAPLIFSILLSRRWILVGWQILTVLKTLSNCELQTDYKRTKLSFTLLFSNSVWIFFFLLCRLFTQTEFTGDFLICCQRKWIECNGGSTMEMNVHEKRRKQKNVRNVKLLTFANDTALILRFNLQMSKIQKHTLPLRQKMPNRNLLSHSLVKNNAQNWLNTI